VLRLNDPRRFGAVLWHSAQTKGFDPLANLGMEPFDPVFTPHVLHQELARRTGAIKTVLLSGKPVVGVGNIYASESLFRAGIHPNRSAQRISLTRCVKLHHAIQEVLQEAIDQGGSTLRDFIGSDGNPGYFQMAHQVYDRTGLPCVNCKTPIRQIRQGQRSTFYCPHCQH
jgi:formamidopyrimidine-DNA glycosylase